MPDTRTGPGQKNEWAKLSAYCIQHRESGHKIARLCPGTQHETYLVTKGERQIGWFATSHDAKHAVRRDMENAT